ncbi:putative copper transporter 2 [Iris pallida]|uniref:Copper transport protein n=1 Tax=Iris pallida TaxID=29817 RepID=A0AAX6FII4_IRIPA|nr:putative copper transporter 2 [Iris pallida]
MDHNHSPDAAMAMPAPEQSYTHMTFFWGARAEVLFAGWPGARPGMYALALLLVLALSVALEWLDRRFLAGASAKAGGGTAAAGLIGRTAVHAVRVAVSYVVMLAVMSFNVGILMAAVAGRAVGFLVFRSPLCGGRSSEPGDAAGACHPPAC